MIHAGLPAVNENLHPEPILNFLRQLMINSYKNYRDNVFRKKIIGSWADSNYYPRFGIASFEEAGVYKAWLYENEKKEKLLFFIEGIWWIDNGYLYNKLSKSTFPLIKSEDVARDMIVDISEDTLTLIDEDNKQYTRTKIR